jgi:protein-tyrosine-phosphatase
MESGDGHDEYRNQLMKNVDVDNMYTTIEKEVQEYETDQMDNIYGMDDNDSQTFILIKVKNIK